MGTILFFEDDKAFAKKGPSDLAKTMGHSVRVHLFLPRLNIGKKKTYSDVLLEELRSTYRNIDLIVTDINLAEIDHYNGLSAEVVEEVGRKLRIPVCIYSAVVKSDTDKFQEVVESRIWLESNPKSREMLEEIRAIYHGFVDLKRAYAQRSSKQKSETPAQMLSRILKRQRYEDRFTLYGLGNQAFGWYAPRTPSLKRKSEDIPYLLGHWMLSSILKFPGVLLNDVAAASHLNISLDDFTNKRVRDIFKRALYHGPFSDRRDYWWRYELDEIIDDNNFSSGLEMVKTRANDKVKPCKCSVDPSLDAGYYCIVTHKPVSIERSTSEVSWIPKGADLARVSNPMYAKLKPWIGLA